MSVYNYFPEHCTTACWVQAANLIDSHNSTNPAAALDGLSLRKSQLLWIGDQAGARIHQLTMSACNDVISTYNLISAMTSRSCEHVSFSYPHLEDVQHHVPAGPFPPSLAHLTPPDAVVGAELHESLPNTSATVGNSACPIENNNDLKFGINRILSENFGPTQTGAYYSRSSQPGHKKLWSRAVFSSLQRKGLENRFQIQKFVTKPDRRELAAMLGLTDAQVKVWFQNRRIKWRHAQQQEVKDKHMEKPGLQSGSDYSHLHMEKPGLL